MLQTAGDLPVGLVLANVAALELNAILGLILKDDASAVGLPFVLHGVKQGALRIPAPLSACYCEHVIS